jgi:hypothetical protein
MNTTQEIFSAQKNNSQNMLTSADADKIKLCGHRHKQMV